MTDRLVRFTVSAEWEHWVRTLGAMEVTPDAVAKWDLVTDVFFDQTQRAAHVLSGDMKRSGRSSTTKQGHEIHGEVEYGGVMGTKGFVDYTEYELERGGSHDFFKRGMRGMNRRFSEGVLAAVETMMKKVEA